MPHPAHPQCSLAELVRAVAAIAPPHLAEDWDNVGLQIGDPSAPVRRVMTCLEVTRPTLKEAIDRQAGAIVAHHPLIFKPLTAINLAQPAGALVAGLVKAGISLVVAHTNLDAAPWSTTTVLAEACGLEIEGPLAPRADGPGIGLIAKPAAPLSCRELADHIGKSMNLSAVRLSGAVKKKIKRIAVCSGSGGSMIGLAAGRADALLTGEINYHHAIDAHHRGIAVIEVGHFESEVIVAPPLAARLAHALGIEVFAAKNDLQPFR